MTSMKEKERDFLLECIRLYKDLPALWKVKSKVYRDRNKKTQAYNLLLSKYNEMYPYATKDDLKKKFNSLRTNYRKELKKYVNAMKSRGNRSFTYVSKLWYFDEMSFLQDEDLQIETDNSMNFDEDGEEQSYEAESYIEDLEPIQSPPPTTNINSTRIEEISKIAYERLNEIRDDSRERSRSSDLQIIVKTEKVHLEKEVDKEWTEIKSDKELREIKRNKERNFLLECIKMYKDLPALWKVKSKAYHDRNKKNLAYIKLLVKYNEMYPHATRDDLKKKFNSLRTNYRKELKKYADAMKAKSSRGSVYVSNLWYFNEMSFLQDEDLAVESDCSMFNDDDSDEQSSETQSSIYESQINETPPPTTIEVVPKRQRSNEQILNVSCETVPPATNLHFPKRPRSNEQILNVSYEPVSEIKDEFQHWGMACAVDLQKMERTQALYAKKAIAEIIMEGQLGLLHRYSVKINETQSMPQCFNATTSSSFRNNSHQVYIKPKSLKIIPAPTSVNPISSPPYE